MPTIDIDLSAPLNLSFTNKKDRQGKFIQNSGVLSEAGLHNAFMESGEGQWMGDFDAEEIRALVPAARVLEFDKKIDAKQGHIAWLTPAIHAVIPNGPLSSIRLSDGREVEVPEELRLLQWKASSGVGNQYMTAARWGGSQMHVHIFHINLSGNPVFSRVDIPLSTSLNTAAAPLEAMRMATGELGGTPLEQYLDGVGRIDCFPVVFGRLEPSEDGAWFDIRFYAPSEDGPWPGLPQAGEQIDGAPYGKPGQWLVVEIGGPVFREDPPQFIPNPDFDPRETLPNPDFDPRREIENPDFDLAEREPNERHDPRKEVENPEHDPGDPGSLPVIPNPDFDPNEWIYNPNYDPRETLPNPGYDPRETLPNPGFDPIEQFPNPNFDPDRQYERLAFLREARTASGEEERFLHVGVDVGSFSLNFCAAIKLNANGSFSLARTVKGFYMPDLSGNVRGFPFPDAHVTLERGYCPRLRGTAGAHLPLNQEIIRADTHRGVVFYNMHLHHLPDTEGRASSDLGATQSRTALVSAWSADRLEAMPIQTCQNYNGAYSNPPRKLDRSMGITALFHGFSILREGLRLTAGGQGFDIPHFGGFYCVPTRKHPGCRMAKFGVAQYSMVGALELRHKSHSERDVFDPWWISGESWPGSRSFRRGTSFGMRHYRSRGHFNQERNIRNASWAVRQTGNVLQRTGGGGRQAYFRCVGVGTAQISHYSQQQHGAVWRNHTQRINITVTPADIEESGSGEARLQLDCGRLLVNYPAKDDARIPQSSYGVTAWDPPASGQLDMGVFALDEVVRNDSAFANALHSGDTQIPTSAPAALSQEIKHSPQALGIFDAWVFGTDGIDVYVTMAAGEALWTSVNDTKIANGAPSQILTYEDAVLLVFDKFTVYAHSTNRNGAMKPEMRILTQRIAVISQTDINAVEKEGESGLRAFHAFSGLGYRTNIAGPRHASGTEEEQSNFQDILRENRHGNVPPPNSLSLPQGFAAQTPPYGQPIQHINININTPPSQIIENVNAFRYSLPVSAERGPDLGEWVKVKGNNARAHIIDGRISLTSDILAARPNLRQLVILGQLFEFDESVISPVSIESGQRVFGTPVNKFNKVFAGASSQRAYFFDLVSKSIDEFNLDSGFSVGIPLDLIDGVLQAMPMNEFSFTNVLKMSDEGGLRETLLHMADTGVFFRDYGDLKVGDDSMLVGIGGVLLQGADGWRLLRSTVLYEHLERINSGGCGRFQWMPLNLQTGFHGEAGLFIVPKFWEVDFYLSAAMRKLHGGRESRGIAVKMGTESIHDSRKWKQPMREYSMRVRDFRDGYFTLRVECLAEECTAQSLIFETGDYVHISAITFKYAVRPGGADR